MITVDSFILILIVYLVIYNFTYHFYLISLKIHNTKLTKNYDDKLYNLLEDVREMSKNYNFDIYISNDIDIFNEKFLKNILFKVYKPNLTIVSKTTIDNNINNLECLKWYFLSESLFRKQFYEDNAILSIISFIIEKLENLKVFNLIIFFYFRWKRKKADKITLKYFLNTEIMSFIEKLILKNQINILEDFRDINGIIYNFYFKLLYYDLFMIQRYINFIQSTKSTNDIDDLTAIILNISKELGKK